MDTLADFFKSLADPTRLRILCCLRGGERCVCDLMAALDMPQSTISRHLATLRHAGLVSGRRGGKWMYYQLNTPESPLAAAVQRILTASDGELQAFPEIMADDERLRHHLDMKCGAECK
jgi:ArsR family transcriptional regulator, arsenate/arsenite/antimonite-responsive transcriptional repressor